MTNYYLNISFNNEFCNYTSWICMEILLDWWKIYIYEGKWFLSKINFKNNKDLEKLKNSINSGLFYEIRQEEIKQCPKKPWCKFKNNKSGPSFFSIIEEYNDFTLTVKLPQIEKK